MAMNKKGFVIELMAFIVIGIILVLFFGGIIYGFNLLNNVATNSSLLDTKQMNVTAATNPTFGNLNSGLSGLHLIAAVILIGYALGTLIFSYFSAKHPLWLIVYIFITILLVIFSIYISNAYETVRSNSLIESIVSGFSISNIILKYLPVWVSVIGLFGIGLSIIGITVARRAFEQ